MRANRIGRVATFAIMAVIALLCLSFVPASAVSPGGNSAATPAASASSPTVQVTSTPTTQTATAATPASGGGPHPGTLDIYEPTGAGTTVDPAAAYYTVNAEPIWNTYETLIAYNGTSTVPTPNGFVPEVATCVPGSLECQNQFGGSTLVFNNATTGAPEYYTFEIDSAARFYDPSTGNSWPIYPSDVVFSFDRTMAFANPFGVYNGWINTQDLIPGGNSSWDGGIHAPFNNTPNHVLSAILVNDSAYCPSASISLATNGCVTFDVGASGTIWPYFLELVADPMGGSVVPCGAFTYLNAGLPGWLGSNATDGDGPCLLPGNATSTSQSAFTNYVASVSPYAWDAVEGSTITNYPSPQAGVQWTMIGSGPYYSSSPNNEINNGVGYFLQANPAYAAPTGCAGQPGCLPEPGQYDATVNVYWEPDDTVGLQQLIAGYADTAGVDASHLGTVLQLVNEGKYGIQTNIPTLSIFFYPFELNFSVAAENLIDTTGQLNVPGDWFSNVGLRQFLINSYPYQTIINTIFTVDGIQLGENYGGMIPLNMGNYYPQNISWPGGDPTSNPTQTGNVTWWWYQLNNPSSQWYDPEVAGCTSSSPCKFPIINFQGAFSVDSAINLEIANVETFSNNSLQPYLLDEPANTIASGVGLPPGYGNMPMYNYGWAPDYPDPTDYVAPMYGPNATYTFVDAVWQQTNEAPYNNVTACGHATPDWANLTYWANIGQLPNDCQGIAYDVMNAWLTTAATETNIPQRTLDYNLAEHIANTLGLYMSLDQSLGVSIYGSWINPATINTNVMIGGGGDQLWFNWGYASNAFDVNFTESGLPAGTTWSVTLGTSTQTSSASTIVFAGQVNGTEPYTIGFVSGYGASPVTGTVTVAGSSVNTAVTFTAFSGTTYSLTLNEQGIVSGTNWTASVAGVGGLRTNQTSMVFAVPAAAYAYTPGTLVGYTNSGPGNVTVTSSGASATIVYTPAVYSTYAVNFTESGLPASSTWAVTLNGFTQTSTGTTISFTQVNGTYGYTITGPAGWYPPSNTGSVTVNGANVNVAVPFSNAVYTVTFTESGLTGSFTWQVNLNGTVKTSSSTTISYTLPNGSYPFSIAAVSGYTISPSSGTTTVAGAAVNEPITFTPTLYTVTFFEGGTLPAGSTWSVTINGVTMNSTTNSLAFNLPNGTQTYTVGVPAGYTASPASGSVLVAGAAQAVVVVISQSTTGATYTVTFTVNGGSGWTVQVNGQTLTPASGANTVQVALANGTYSFGVIAPSGWYASPSGGTFTVNGAPVPVPAITLSQTTTTGTSTNSNYLGTLAYALIGVFAVLALIFLVLAIMFARRKPPMGNPPQSWQGSDNKGDGSSQSPPSS